MPHMIRTERVLMRPARLQDAPAIARVFNDFEVAKATKTWPYPVTSEHARSRLRHWMKIDEAVEFGRVIVYQGEVVGSLGVQHCVGDRWSIGYGLHRDHWGKGLVTEAVRAFCGFGFQTLRIGTIEAHVFKDNPASQNVALKVGFRFAGDIGPGWSTALQGNFPRWGYELTREDFQP